MTTATQTFDTKGNKNRKQKQKNGLGGDTIAK